MRPKMLGEGSSTNGPGERCTESVISISSVFIGTSDIEVDCGSVILYAGDAGEDHGEKTDRSWGARFGSSSESAGVIVGGVGWEV